MSTFLFRDTIFGPVHSRRLGSSLGINLLSNHYKQCTFNCIYCECGWTDTEKSERKTFLSCSEISEHMENKLSILAEQNVSIDNITFAGNGEPTIHPEFPVIIDETIRLRNKYYPESKISVLSNATMLHNIAVIEALKKIENNIQKLDCGSETTFQKMNKPLTKITLNDIINQLCKFTENLTIQTMFLKGEYSGQIIDNTTDEEVKLWLEHLKKIRPALVMIYPIARATPTSNLVKLKAEELQLIAKKVEKTGIKIQVYP
jgi:wyosine [tRNA(Phe)-imidazoG37] synthetase (radical SAM superfamily)